MLHGAPLGPHLKTRWLTPWRFVQSEPQLHFIGVVLLHLLQLVPQ